MLDEIKSRSIRHELAENRDINMTPMMDVIFQLLIFFILTSTLVKPNMIELDLPESTTGVKNKEPDLISVTYRLQHGAPVITLNGEAVSDLGSLGKAIMALKQSGGEPRHRVDIQIDRTVPYQDVISVIDTVRDAGFPRFSLQTLMPSGTPKPSS